MKKQEIINNVCIPFTGKTLAKNRNTDKMESKFHVLRDKPTTGIHFVGK
jgi:hypothetical protein